MVTLCFVCTNEAARACQLWSRLRTLCRLRLAGCWLVAARGWAGSALPGAFPFVRSTESFSVLWWGSDAKESRLSGVSGSHSSNDSLCHQSSGWPRQRRPRWRMRQQLSLEEWRGAVLGLDFPQVMASRFSVSCCARNLFPSPPRPPSPNKSHQLQAVFESFSQAGFLQGCGISAVTFKEWKHSRSSPSSMWRFLMQMKSCSWLEGRGLRLRRVESCNYVTVHSDPPAEVRATNYAWKWNLLLQEVQIGDQTRCASVVANALADKSSHDDVRRCVNLWVLDEIY